MRPQGYILTTKDFTILEVMRDRCAADDPLAALLDRKIARAVVVFRDDVPANVATLSSRVRFRANGEEPDTRIISHDAMTSAVGLFLPVTTLRGAALIGLCEGDGFRYLDRDGAEQHVLLEKVLHQPEAARREREAAARLATAGPGRPRPRLMLIHDAQDKLPPRATDHASWQGGPDDPGPAAA